VNTLARSLARGFADSPWSPSCGVRRRKDRLSGFQANARFGRRWPDRFSKPFRLLVARLSKRGRQTRLASSEATHSGRRERGSSFRSARRERHHARAAGAPEPVPAGPSLSDRELRERLRRRANLVRLKTWARNRMFGLLTSLGGTRQPSGSSTRSTPSSCRSPAPIGVPGCC
jgi:hypothetical protein